MMKMEYGIIWIEVRAASRLQHANEWITRNSRRHTLASIVLHDAEPHLYNDLNFENEAH
jgi:hypothetical protein